jgi:hypothetical protein
LKKEKIMSEKIIIPAEQGDVTLIKADIPQKLLKGKKRKTKAGRVILAFGEATGHHHSLDTKKAYILEPTPELNALFNAQVGIPKQASILDAVLVVEAPDEIKHQEHSGLQIAPGVYWEVIEQEYTPGRIERARD